MHKVAKYYGLPSRDFTPAALDACQNYSWPGNLKELETFVKRYLIAGDEELPHGDWRQIPTIVRDRMDEPSAPADVGS